MISSFRETLLFLISTPLYIIFIGLEVILSAVHKNNRYSVKGAWQNFYIMLINLVIDLGMRTVGLFCLMAFFNHQLLHIQNTLLYWLLLFLAQDITFYTMHLLDHKVRLFWAVHVTHHSSEEFNLSVGFRSSVFEPVYRFLYFIPMAILGFAPLDIFFVFSITQLYGIFIHTQYVKKLGFLEWFMATPSHHRVHHGKNPEYIDRNMGMFLIIWDRLFGTFEPEVQPVVFGITKPPLSNRADDVILHEFRNMLADVKQAPGFKAKLMYIFGPPGWQHEEGNGG
jgi:sterol desaturase/sphingolipid hydroxylase (fatty acid hydroxylase superfamily)